MESAFLERISDATVLVKLEFSVSGEYLRTCEGTFCVDDYGSFPISPARILLDSKARSVALSTTRGLWRSDQWGPAINTTAQSPSGSLLQAEFRSLDQKSSSANLSGRNRTGQTQLHGCTGGGLDADEGSCVGLRYAGGSDRTSVGDRWRLLKALTSGVFCASLNKNTAFSSPFYFDAPRHESSASVRVGQYFPEESVCTENIDMWKKLIPNVPSHEEDSATDSTTVEHENDEDGLKGLIDKNWLLYSPWHSLRFEAFSGIDRNATDDLNTSKHKKWRSKQELSMTLSVSAILLPKTLPSHSIVLKRLEEHVQKRKNSLSSELKSESTQQTDISTKKLLEPCGARLHRQVKDSRERKFFAEMIVEDSSCTLVPEEHSLPLGSKKSTVFSQDSYPKEVVSTRVHVTELLPPFYDMLLHTYTYSIAQKIPINPKNVTRTKELYVADLGSFKFHPGGVNDNKCYNRNSDKNSPEGYEGSPYSDYGESSRSCYGSVSWTVDLPLGAVLRSQFTAEKKHLHREQYPSDASRGFIVPPVFVTLTSTSRASILGTPQSEIMYTPMVSSPTLITFPLPDASMPFNVTTLVCTVMSFLLGSLMNTLLRKKKKKEVQKDKGQDHLNKVGVKDNLKID